jgi:hypothetical protein
MRKIAVTLFAAILAINLSAQDNEVFSKGDKVLNVGIGFGGGYYSGFFYSGYSRSPFFSGSFDVGIIDGFLDNATVGIGGYVGFSSAKWDGINYGWKETHFVIGPRGTFNYQFVDKLDTYAGILLGYNIVNEKRTGDWSGQTYNGNSSSVYFSGFVGARYYFTENIGAFLELGSGGLSLASLGIVAKF